jgi:hypothetical protein
MAKTYFISGHRDISKDEFELHYASKIRDIVEEDPYAKFVVGDYHGVDNLAQIFLYKLVEEGILAFDSITVYHMFTEPRNNLCAFKTIGGFTSDIERDSAMTNISDEDIAWVRLGKESSGTAQNLMRR